jgi:hypothetical protein
MALGVMLLSRVPASSAAWTFRPDVAGSLVPPAGYLSDFLPAFLLFGTGLCIMVAPLTTALMTSVPVHNSGLGSAINNAISRVGPQLAGALIFVAVTGSFYSGLAARVPGLDTSSAQVRAKIAPLNAPTPGVPDDQRAAAREASTDAFHLAMRISAALLILGAIINAVGIRPLAPGPAT